MEVGPCEALQQAYFFNASSGQCEIFNYGGCGGNENRFATATECFDECSPDGNNTCAKSNPLHALWKLALIIAA